ncbi:MAG: hypothetical protein HC819_22275 [Cyclobacteriaceae bacterium]|nr:hypothetical protein [Cyclobacteriaceae bacterium]
MFAFVTGCEGPEGPMGPAGADGTNGTDGTNGVDGKDGVDGNVTCLECHSATTPDITMEQFRQSAHSKGAIAVDYAGGRKSCAKCHSHEGYLEFARTGTVAQDIATPSAWQCKTCHNIHTTFEETDYALRLNAPVTFASDPTTAVDLGNSNTCANCHQARRAEPNLDVPGETFVITSTHYGPHYGTQANILYGVGFASIPGDYTYPVVGQSPHMQEGAKCTGCHMYDYGNGKGGHTFNPALDACNTCHGADNSDFNYKNTQTEVSEMLVELKGQLMDLGVLDAEGHVVPGTYPMLQAQAYFNYDGMLEDRSLGAHNPEYVKAILKNTIAALK